MMTESKVASRMETGEDPIEGGYIDLGSTDNGFRYLQKKKKKKRKEFLFYLILTCRKRSELDGN